MRVARAAWQLVLAAMLVASPLCARAELAITDVTGREVRLDGPVDRLLIDDARVLIALSLLDPDPVARLATWPKDIHRIGQIVYERYMERFPALADLPAGPSSAGDFSTELVIATAPDAAVFTVGTGPTPEQVAQVEAAGIPVVFIDFFSHPLRNLAPSLRILGQLIGREQAAADFIAFRDEHLAAITKRVLGLAEADRPKVFVEVHAGMSDDCCSSPGKGNLGDYVELAGGHNIGADVLDRPFGRLNLEYVIAAAPDVYIATGGPHLEKAGGLVIGPGYTAAQAQEALARLAARPGIAQLPAVTERRAHALSHQLLNSPLDILAVEVLAKWIQPDLFADLDPAATQETINRKFLAVPQDGIFWANLP